jgi:hypothetical protein
MTPGHVQELKLRRFSVGEPLGDERADIEAHAAACAPCRARLKEIGDQQKRFEHEISFDRFAAGVERAARTPRRPASLAAPVGRWIYPALGMAAAVALTVTFAPRVRPQRGGVQPREGVGAEGRDQPGAPLNRSKGGGGIVVRIAGGGTGAQRTAAAAAPERLAPGERIRIGYQPGAHRYLTSLSIDDAGQVTPLYPEAGRSLPIAPGPAGATTGSPASPSGSSTRYLPDSVEFTGQGRERLIVILGDRPLEVDTVRRAARAAYERAKGDLTQLAPLDVPGEQFHRTFVKP